MRQYNQSTTGATFSIIDYGTRRHGPHGNKSANLVYITNDRIYECGWFESRHEAMAGMSERAEMFGVSFVGKPVRVA